MKNKAQELERRIAELLSEYGAEFKMHTRTVGLYMSERDEAYYSLDFYGVQIDLDEINRLAREMEK